MTITRNFKLYLNAGTASAPYINVNQYDEGEEWIFTLYNEDGSTYSPSSGAIIGIKSDGNAIMNAGSVVGGKVVITETEQMTAASGRAIFELLIDNATHGTANFIVNVERRPSDDAEFSDSDLSMLQEAIDAAEVINEILDEGGDPSEVIGEHVDDWLDNHPEATTTVQDGAITAPKLNSTLWDKLLVSEEASGAVASFDDGADDVPVSSLKVTLEPIQTGSGDPSPTNIRPISGHSSVTVERTGKNVSQNTSATATSTGRMTINSGTFGTCLANTEYTISFDVLETNTAQVDLRFNDVTPKLTSWNASALVAGNRYSYTFTPTADGALNFYSANAAFTASTKVLDNIQVEKGSTASGYEPYTSASYPYSLGQSVYGGTVDLATGVLTVTHAYASLNDSTKWEELTSATVNYRYSNEYSDRKKYSDSYVGVICSCLPIASGQPTYGRWLSSSSNYFGIRNTTGTITLDEVKALATANQIQICYELATPTTVQLTPQEVKTLLGYNNISSSGTVDVIYHADTKLYIDKKIGEIS